MLAVPGFSGPGKIAADDVIGFFGKGSLDVGTVRVIGGSLLQAQAARYSAERAQVRVQRPVKRHIGRREFAVQPAAARSGAAVRTGVESVPYECLAVRFGQTQRIDAGQPAQPAE